MPWFGKKDKQMSPADVKRPGMEQKPPVTPAPNSPSAIAPAVGLRGTLNAIQKRKKMLDDI